MSARGLRRRRGIPGQIMFVIATALLLSNIFLVAYILGWVR